ncbi:MAG: TonB-dependent receptor [Agarilytica sp.]
MKKYLSKKKNLLAAFPVSALSLAISSVLYAQEPEAQTAPEKPVQEEQQPSEKVIPTTNNTIQVESPIEDVLVLGRLKSAAQDLALERMEFETVVDLLGADQISRVGDSTVASALRRIPGVTLIDGQFIYVRGLGERYSSSILNGATVPSPDLTRNVLPLDIFPTSIVESIAVQKGYTADMPAAFGGGNVNIRTKGIPDELVIAFEIGAGIHSDSDQVMTYGSGHDMGEDDGSRTLSGNIDSALRTYSSGLTDEQPSLTVNAIQDSYARQGSSITQTEAQTINTTLAAELNRDLAIREESKTLHDTGLSLSLGNRHELGSKFEIGYLLNLSQDESIRNTTKIQREYNEPDQEFSEENKSTETYNLTVAANVGIRWGEEHEISSKNLFIRNTDDEVSFTDVYSGNESFSSGRGDRNYDYRFEERELEVYQFTGKHVLGFETREKLGLGDSLFSELELNWFWSDATATTDIPSETNLQGDLTRNTSTGEITSTALRQGISLMDVRFTELEDQVESSGFALKLPYEQQGFELELLAGGKYDSKTRSYEQLDLSMGSQIGSVPDGDSIGEALNNANILNPAYDYTINYEEGLSRSYLAATTTDAFFGQADITVDSTWRLVAGARYEEYKQFSAPWQPYRRVGSALIIDTEENDYVFYQDNVYGSLSLTYMTQSFGAQDFNLRLAVSETVVRPDLREVADASYRDPLTDVVVEGNPDVVPSELTNFDFRGEWFYTNGDSLTVSLFYKDIQNPIEYYQRSSGETGRTAKIENAESGSIYGLEVEWLNSLEFLSDAAEPFYVSGNVTIAESEIATGDDLLVPATNRNRPLRGASDYVANIQLGFDSDDGKHAATLVYNVFGKRLFSAGIDTEPDEFEQPFNSLDLVYSFYPTNNYTIKFKAKNLFDENIEIKQGKVTTFEKTVGMSYGIDFKYSF